MPMFIPVAAAFMPMPPIPMPPMPLPMLPTPMPEEDERLLDRLGEGPGDMDVNAPPVLKPELLWGPLREPVRATLAVGGWKRSWCFEVATVLLRRRRASASAWGGPAGREDDGGPRGCRIGADDMVGCVEWAAGK